MSIKKDLGIRSVIGGGDADGCLRYWGEKLRHLSLDRLQLAPVLQFPVNAKGNHDGVVANSPRMPTLLPLRCYMHPGISFSIVGTVQLDSRPWETEVHYDRLSNWICLSLCYLADCLQQGLISAVYWLCSYCYCGEVAELKVGSDPYALSVIKMSRNADATASYLMGHAAEMSWNLQAALQRADSC